MAARERPLIILSDDDPGLRSTLSEFLDLVGYDVLEAPNGVATFALTREHAPDLILLDVTMPGFDGYEVVRWLREDAQTHAIPIIMVTGHAETPDEIKGLQSGADDYLTKPFDLDVLLGHVQAVLRRSRPPPSASAP